MLDQLNGKLAFILLAGIFSLVSLTSCATKKQADNENIETDHIVEKSYELGQRQKAFLGEAMVRIKDYHVKLETTSTLSPNKDFTSRAGPVEIYGKKDKSYPLLGAIGRGEDQRRVLKIEDTDGNPKGLLITKHDTVGNRMLKDVESRQPIYIAYNVTTVPSDVKFETVTKRTIDSKSAQTNFEIIYSGQSGDSIVLSYREYPPEDRTRPTVIRELTYPKDTNIIQFKDLKIKVHGLTKKEIEFTVLKDGRPKNSSKSNGV